MDTKLDELIQEIRKEEREKILKEIKGEQSEKMAWKKISDAIDRWGNNANKTRWETNKVKNSIYTLIRYALEIAHMAHLREEQYEMALEIATEIINIIDPEYQELISV